MAEAAEAAEAVVAPGGSGGGAGGGYYTVGGGRDFSDSDRQESSPLNITLGAIRFNTDSMKLEYFRISTEGGDTSSSNGRGTVAAGEWVQITTDTPDIQTGGTRGLHLVVGILDQHHGNQKCHRIYANCRLNG